MIEQEYFENINLCPYCEEREITDFVIVKDYNNGFGFIECPSCGFTMFDYIAKRKEYNEIKRV